MLTIEPPFYSVRGCTVFRDSENADQFWVLPAPPRLVADAGHPPFTLYKYRRDLTDNPVLEPTRARGGGLALFDVETAPPPLTALAADVAGLAGRPDALVSPVVFRSGTVRAIVAQASENALVEQVVQSTVASPVAPHRATFALALSAEGATLVEQAALGGLLPVGVAYELRFLALTPALHARVTMSYARMYDHFSASAAFTYYVQAKFDLDVSWLVEHDLIHVEITAFTDEADAKRQQDLVLGLVAERVQQDFFRSGVPADPPPPAGTALSAVLDSLLGGSKVSSASALFVLKAKVEVVHEDKDFVLVYDGRTAIELTHVSTGLLATMVAGGEPPQLLPVDLDDPFFATLDVAVVADLDPDDLPDLDRAVVDLAHGDTRASYEFVPGGPDRARFTVPLTDPREDGFEVRYAYHFAGDAATGDPELTVPPTTTRDRVVVVNPLEHLDYARVRVLLGPLDLALVPQLHVDLQLVSVDDAAVLAAGRVTLNAQQTEAVWRHHAARGPRWRTLVRTTWEDASGVQHEGERTELPAGATSYVALGPFRDVLQVSVVPAVDWSTGASHALVELGYTDGEYVVDTTLTFLAADGATAQSVALPLLDPAHRTYRWRQVVFTPAGPVSSAWTDADVRVLVVGAAAPTTGDVRLVWVGDPAGAFGLRVDLRVTTAAGELVVSRFLRAGVDADLDVLVPLTASGALSYRYEVRRVAADGEALVQSGESQTGLLVLRSTPV